MDETLKKNRSSDVVLELKGIEGKATLAGYGAIDKDLFTGSNKLHAILDPQTMLWHLKYERGVIPQELQQRFTHYDKLMNFVRNYFSKRNIEIVDVKD